MNSFHALKAVRPTKAIEKRLLEKPHPVGSSHSLDDVIALQRLIGNQALQRLVAQGQQTNTLNTNANHIPSLQHTALNPSLKQRRTSTIQRCGCGGKAGEDGECPACRAKREARESALQTAPMQRKEDPSIQRFWDDDESIWDSVSNAASGAAQWVGETASSAAETVGNTASGAASWASETAGEAAQWVDTTSGEVAGTLNGSGGVEEIFADVGSTAGGWMGETYSGVQELAGDAWNSFDDTIDSARDWVLGNGDITPNFDMERDEESETATADGEMPDFDAAINEAIRIVQQQELAQFSTNNGVGQEIFQLVPDSGGTLPSPDAGIETYEPIPGKCCNVGEAMRLERRLDQASLDLTDAIARFKLAEGEFLSHFGTRLINWLNSMSLSGSIPPVIRRAGFPAVVAAIVSLVNAYLSSNSSYQKAKRQLELAQQDVYAFNQLRLERQISFENCQNNSCPP